MHLSEGLVWTFVGILLGLQATILAAAWRAGSYFKGVQVTLESHQQRLDTLEANQDLFHPRALTWADITRERSGGAT